MTKGDELDLDPARLIITQEMMFVEPGSSMGEHFFYGMAKLLEPAEATGWYEWASYWFVFNPFVFHLDRVFTLADMAKIGTNARIVVFDNSEADDLLRIVTEDGREYRLELLSLNTF